MEEVVIAGMSGKLPESENLQEFWDNLIGGVDMVTDDDRRWKAGAWLRGSLWPGWRHWSPLGEAKLQPPSWRPQQSGLESGPSPPGGSPNGCKAQGQARQGPCACYREVKLRMGDGLGSLDMGAEPFWPGCPRLCPELAGCIPGLYGLPRRSGKLKDLSRFDASFFGVHPKQAHTMDPQLRLLLEVTYEAIVDGGINPASLRGTHTGVWVGVSGSEASEALSRDPETLLGYSMVGCQRAMMANRLSFFFDFRGPSIALDTACSSSLLALHNAYEAIRSGVCPAAIVGGINVLLKPNTSVQFMRLGMLSPEGACKAFDEAGSLPHGPSPSTHPTTQSSSWWGGGQGGLSLGPEVPLRPGNGYCRSEAVVAVLLTKKSLARRVYATILNAGTNTDGCKEQGVTFPSGEVQEQLIRSLYQPAGVAPESLEYIEAHGTGTKVGDPQELNGIVQALCATRQEPLLIGSTKSNMGHPEPASGLAALAKVLLSLEHGLWAPNLHFHNPNPEIPALLDGRLQVVEQPLPVRGGNVGINSFGFGGSNVHVILKPNTQPPPAPAPHATLPHLLRASGRTPEAVHELLEQGLQHSQDLAFLSMLNNIAAAPATAMPFRGYAVLGGESSGPEVQQVPTGERPVWFICSGEPALCPPGGPYPGERAGELELVAPQGALWDRDGHAVAWDGAEPPVVLSGTGMGTQWHGMGLSLLMCSLGQEWDGAQPPVVFSGTGMGTQWRGMGLNLMRLSLFRDSILRSDEAVKPLGLKVSQLLLSTDESTFDDIVHAFVSLTAIQIGLIDLLSCMGLRPDGIIGHSLGEVACGYADGCLSQEEAVLSAYWRGQCIKEANIPKGAMAAVEEAAFSLWGPHLLPWGYPAQTQPCMNPHAAALLAPCLAVLTLALTHRHQACMEPPCDKDTQPQHSKNPGPLVKPTYSAFPQPGLSWEECKQRCPPGVVPACHNSEDTVTISGPQGPVHEFVEQLKQEGVFAKEVRTGGMAFHSYFMEGIAPPLLRALKKVIREPKPRSARWLSTSIPEAQWHTSLAHMCSPEYNVNNLVSPVLFQEALGHVPEHAVVLEIAPHALLQALGTRSLGRAAQLSTEGAHVPCHPQAVLKRGLKPSCTIIPLMKKDHRDNLELFLAGIGKLHLSGIDANPNALFPPVEFPVPRGTPLISPLIKWDHSLTWDVPAAEDFPNGSGSPSASVYTIDASPESPDHYLVDHRIDGRIIFPATGYLCLVWKTLARALGLAVEQLPVVFEDVVVHQATILPKTGEGHPRAEARAAGGGVPPSDLRPPRSVGTMSLEVQLLEASHAFEVSESGHLIVSGKVHQWEDPDPRLFDHPESPAPSPGEPYFLAQAEVYKDLRLCGYDYGPHFQGILEASLDGMHCPTLLPEPLERAVVIAGLQRAPTAGHAGHPEGIEWPGRL
ncbi:hypothetical protein P7K49_012156 [Saguinus oedipus]|uniref:Fatty acid synthase n=1 Tax=Saguinus oedipus TaxID=9490 RepID=A0ABQ9VSN8_SAGOE|nr:hypothetical protein P7K49_012156 [Saguinus oedipus]